MREHLELCTREDGTGYYSMTDQAPEWEAYTEHKDDDEMGDSTS